MDGRRHFTNERSEPVDPARDHLSCRFVVDSRHPDELMKVLTYTSTLLLLAACRSSDRPSSDASPMDFQVINGRAMETVLRSFGSRIRQYAFTERPFCADPRTPYCVAHSEPELKAVHARLEGAEPNRGYSFLLSPVRDSAGVKVVNLITSIVETRSGGARGELVEFVLDQQGTTVISRRTLESY